MLATTDAAVHIDRFGRTHLNDGCEENRFLNDELLVSMQHVGTGFLVTLSGTLDKATAPALREILTWPKGTRSPRIYLDMEHVWSIDVTGLDLVDELSQHDAPVIRHSDACDCLREMVA